MSAQDQTYKIYHSDLYLNEIGTTWEISESNDGDYGYISISDQHSYWNKLVLSFSMPNCDQPEVFFQVFTAGFRKHEGIVEREDLLNETRVVMQVDDEPPYWVDSEIRLVSKFENMIDKDFIKNILKAMTCYLIFFWFILRKGLI